MPDRLGQMKAEYLEEHVASYWPGCTCGSCVDALSGLDRLTEEAFTLGFKAAGGMVSLLPVGRLTSAQEPNP